MDETPRAQDDSSGIGYVDADTSRMRADYAQWRGAITAQVNSHTEALARLHELMLRQEDQRDRNFNRRMDKQDETMNAIYLQAKKTNGRVTKLETESVAKDAADKATETEHAASDERRRERIETNREDDRRRQGRLNVAATLGSGTLAVVLTMIVHYLATGHAL